MFHKLIIIPRTLMVFTKHITVDWTVKRKFQINIMISDTVYLSAVYTPIQNNRNNIIEQMAIGKVKSQSYSFIYCINILTAGIMSCEYCN